MTQTDYEPHHPDFLVIGAQKSGTKWLYWNLKAHPAIFLPEGGGQEVHYFDDDIVFGNQGWYEDHYPQGHFRVPGIKAGDITPDYACLPLERIEAAYKMMPNARVVYTLRNPKQRVISHLRMVFKKTLIDYVGENPGVKLLPNSPLEEHIAFCRFGIGFDHSNYTANLDRWMSVYPKEQILLVNYDELKRNPEHYLAGILRFLGVGSDIDDRYPIRDRYHVSKPYPIRDALSTELDSIYDPVIRELQNRLPFNIRHWLKPTKA